jgi:hypothetical protein
MSEGKVLVEIPAGDLRDSGVPAAARGCSTQKPTRLLRKALMARPLME